MLQSFEVKFFRFVSIFFVTVASVSAATEFTTDFDALAIGSVTAADLNSVSTGGTWFFNPNRGATHESQESAGDKALLLDDADSNGNDGEILFAGVTLDSPIDLGANEVTWTFRTATRRTGNSKGLRFQFVNDEGESVANVDWSHGGALTLNEQSSGVSSFAFLNPWDTNSNSVRDVSITISGSTVTVSFEGVSLSSSLLNPSEALRNLRIWSVGSSVSARGVFLDGMTLETEPLTFQSQEFHYRDLASSNPNFNFDLIRVYIPLEDTPGVNSRPAILMFHGGGWASGDLSQFDFFCEEFAKMGFVAATANYRFTTNSAASSFDDPKELCISDARLATAWFEERASTFGFADGQIILGGGSAGGHLATMVTLQPDELAAVTTSPLSIPAMLLFNPAYHESEINGADSLRVDPERQLAEMVALSELPPPAIYVYGNFDQWRTPDDFINSAGVIENGIGRGLNFIDASRDAGANAKLWYGIGQDHSFFNAIDWMERCILTMDNFLRGIGISGASVPPVGFAHPELNLELATALHSWRLRFFQNEVNEGDAAEGENPDGDEFTNFSEFALGLDPLVSEQAAPLNIAQDNLLLLFSRRAHNDAFSDPSAVVELQSSHTLAPDSWQSVLINSNDITGVVDEVESLAVPFDVASDPTTFFRLQIRALP